LLALIPVCAGQTDKDLADLSIEELLNVKVTSAARKPQSLRTTAAAAFVITSEDTGTSEPFIIGVLLPDPFNAGLDEVVRSVKISGRRVEVRRVHKLGDVRRCHLLFVPRDAEYLAADLPRAGRLTVGESPQFLASGGIINFYLQDNHVRFEIDPNAAQLAGVRISAHVLQLGVRR